MKRALIIEDSRTQAKRLAHLLSDAGFEVEQAFDGLAGLRACELQVPDLVVSDIVMPGLDGFEVCRRLRANPATADLPIMLLTSLADPMDVVRALAAGASNFVTKPYRDEDLLSRLFRMLESSSSRDEPYLFELQGERIHLQAHPGRIAQLLVSALEDAKVRNEELERGRLALEHANALRDDMMAIVAHELRTPLTNVSLRAQRARKQGIGTWPEAAVDVIDSVTRSTERMLRIIEDLLQATELDAGSFSIERRVVDVVELAREVVRRADSPGSPVTLISGDAVTASVDPTRIEQVLSNLVGNALKYSRDKRDVEVSVTADHATFELRVRDFGIGMAPSQVPRVFDRFYRTQQGMSKAKGLGLGLYISRKLVELHGGTIGVESVEGQGSVFWLRVPRV